MSAQRKVQDAAEARTASQGSRPSPTLALAGATPASSPVHDHLARLEASFAEHQGPPPFPRHVRVAIMVGAPVTLWALVIVAVGAVARAVGA